MIVFSWIHLIDPILTKQLMNVFLSAFLPQGRLNAEQYSSYFNNKILPGLEKGQLVIAAYDKDKLVGFAIFEKRKQQSYYLAEMSVLPDYQRQGIGTQLVFSIFNKDKGAEKIFLVTAKDNRWSQSFYEKIGFKHSSFQHVDYPENFIGYEFYRNI
jgi:ribosomal protein S18 acetylase RimI-like enzyme